MKRITLALSCLIFIQLANAQVLKGSLFTGGSANITSTTVNYSAGQEVKSNIWSISPQLGIGIQQNKVLGIQLFAGANSYEGSNGMTSKSSGKYYGGGFFYRQYFPVHNKWMLFGQANVSASFGNGKSSNEGIKTDRNTSWGIGLGVTPGIGFQISKKVWLEASMANLLGINYNCQKSDILDPSGTVTSTSTRKDFSAIASVNGFSGINLGIRWIIPKS